jgi:hypothetical protein
MSSGFDQFGQPGPYDQSGSYGQQGSGWPQPGQPGWQQPRRTNTLAIAALCCGIGQVIAGPFAGIPAIVLGFMSVNQIRRTGENGRGLAITGLVLGIVGTMLLVLGIVLLVAFANHVTGQLNQQGSTFP